MEQLQRFCDSLMFLRYNRRFKDGKEHCYWNIVENKRCAGGKVVQRQVLYLGEINDGQRQAWCHLIEAFDEGAQRHRQLALFPAGAVRKLATGGKKGELPVAMGFRC